MDLKIYCVEVHNDIFGIYIPSVYRIGTSEGEVINEVSAQFQIYRGMLSATEVPWPTPKETSQQRQR